MKTIATILIALAVTTASFAEGGNRAGRTIIGAILGAVAGNNIGSKDSDKARVVGAVAGGIIAHQTYKEKSLPPRSNLYSSDSGRATSGPERIFADERGNFYDINGNPVAPPHRQQRFDSNPNLDPEVERIHQQAEAAEAQAEYLRQKKLRELEHQRAMAEAKARLAKAQKELEDLQKQ